MFFESVHTIHRRLDGVGYDIEIDFRSKHVEIRRLTGTDTELLGAGMWIAGHIESRSAAPPERTFDWAEAELRKEFGR
jgi:hypothetical protein